MKQTVGNACDTVGLLYCVINAVPQLTILKDSNLERLIAVAATMSLDDELNF